MQTTFFLVSLFIFTSCGLYQKNPPHQFDSSDPYFDKYKALYNELAADYGVRLDVSNVHVQFKHYPDNGALGSCYTYPDGHREVTINIDTWVDFFVVTRVLLMIHELTHCSALDANHNDIYHKRFPVSIMNTYMMDSTLFIDYSDYLLEELFTGNMENIKAAYDVRYTSEEYNKLNEEREEKLNILLTEWGKFGIITE
jgi:hypothetical protein